MYIPLHFPRWLTTINGNILTNLAQLKVLWRVWDLRTFTLISLGLQAVLILVAPFRKKSGNLLIIVSIWLAYLLADYVATQAVGLVPKSAFNNSTSDHLNSISIHNVTHMAPHADLIAFWSPFLLVHLGGPDTITALALEDNELWLRTMLHLATQVTATCRVFFQALPNSLLWFPTVIMFVAGFLKYLERSLSLYYARMTKFKSSMLKDPDPGPNYAKLMETYDSYKDFKLPVTFSTNLEPDQEVVPYEEVMQSETEEEKDEDVAIASDRGGIWRWITGLGGVFRRQKTKVTMKNLQLVRDSYEFYQKYKGLYVDLIFSFRDRIQTRDYFLKELRTAEEVFKVIEIELNFTYEVFFTKMVVIHRHYGIVLRCISFGCEVLACVIWILFINKEKFHTFDVRITYTLLGGAIVLEVIAFARLLLSDWIIAVLNKESEVRASLYDKILSWRDRTWGEHWGPETCPLWQRLMRVLFRRWCESVRGFNLIGYCVDPWSKWAEFFFWIAPIQDKFEEVYVTKQWFADDLRDFIFEEIKYKAEIAEDPKDVEEVCESKGDWILRSLAGLDHLDPFKFYPWTVDVEYDECLLLWHIATELLYQKELPSDPDGSSKKATKDKEEEEKRVGENEKKERTEEDNKEEVDGSLKKTTEVKKEEKRVDGKNEKKERKEEDYKRYCKTLSDYMMYLLNRQSEMMLAVAGISEVRFRDTCAETTKFFQRVLPKANRKENKVKRQKDACERIMSVNTEKNPREIKGDRSKSVLFDACCLANKLNEIEKSKVKKWELMAKVWVELVSYSATHCRAIAHAAQLKQGGELLTLVWLLMVHLGLGRQFRITQGNARSKLIIKT